jgi:MinD superfamily P-loop ATPase
MKEIVVISGKGGTGKTSITASFAYLGGKDVVVADCDVDAADMHLLLKPDFAKSEDFYSGVLASINQEVCIQCGKCADVCRFDAIPAINDEYRVVTLDCEGCGYCARICPTDAITMEEQNVGQWYVSTTKAGNPMVHARLGIGAENSGKLVARVKKEAKRIAEETNRDFVLVDGSPGVGCPVVSSLSGANFVVLVTEPTVSGLHDLKRVYQLVEKFQIRAGCIINKSDLNLQVSGEIEDFLRKESIFHVSNLPYDETFTEAMTLGQTIVEYENHGLETALTNSWEQVKRITKSVENER